MGKTVRSKIIFIPGNVPALKNSREIGSFGPQCPACGRRRFASLRPSKRIERWKSQTAKWWRRYRTGFADQIDVWPASVGFWFARQTRHRFDFTNAIDTIQDAMVKFKWIPDDDSSHIIPVVLGSDYRKTEPGVFIKVLNDRSAPEKETLDAILHFRRLQ